MDMKGCAFHWAQAVLRNVKEVGLQTTYERRESVHGLIRKLLALPFLPGPHIPRAFDCLRDKAEANTAQMRSLFEYVEIQWIESSLWSE
ncbi:hypothetical protein DPMN_146192 [Dreissena polymorpha]|uniref:Transposase n=1 Tax=Dreissena polymorpha TaxID=45954 RepID=A0A9D4J1V5_DREPO|nr:hypothetical protein DPMN_146192 [Dreissena polymorpha]